MESRLIQKAQVRALTSLGNSTLYREMQKGRFPRPVKLTESRVAWLEAEVLAWIQQRADQRGPTPALE